MKQNVLILILGLAVSFLSNACTLPFANRSIAGYDATIPAGNTVTTTVTGPTLLFSMLPLNATPDAKDALINLMKTNGCKDLGNIEMDYYDQSFIVLGVGQLKITAVCMK